MKYNLKRTCSSCQNVDIFPIEKMEAAFELYDTSKLWKSNCSKCGSSKFSSLEDAHPKLDQEILDIWGKRLDLHLMIQDEELFLAEIEYLPLILNALDEKKYLKIKLGILIESICILLYDNTVSSEEYTDEENVERQKIAQVVRLELIKRKENIIESEDMIMDYIKEEVYPQIGLTFNNKNIE